MSGLIEALRLLRSFGGSLNPQWEQPIIDHFRQTYLRRFEDAKREYCQRALEGHYVTDTKLKELLGYSSSASISDIRKATISLEMFDLLQATVGSHVKFPSVIERRIETFIETVDFVRRQLMQQKPTMIFDAATYHCVEQSFAEDLTAYELELEGDERGWLRHLFKRVRSVVPAEFITQPDQLAQVLHEWGPAYLTTKNALLLLIKEAPKSHDAKRRT
jgi:hypothetical protein